MEISIKQFVVYLYSNFNLFKQIIKKLVLLDNLQNQRLDDNEFQIILQNTLEGLNYLHEDTQIIHRDLKPSNLLVHIGQNFEITIKIADFGCSIKKSQIKPNNNTWCGTPGFMVNKLFFIISNI